MRLYGQRSLVLRYVAIPIESQRRGRKAGEREREREGEG
jgi:hypothetical protein